MSRHGPAAGPLLSGIQRDLTGDYVLSLRCFAALAGLSVLAALLARRPALPPLGPAVL